MIFREPTDRVLSLYYFIKNRPDVFGEGKVLQENMSLEEYVASDLDWQAQNYYTCSILACRPDQIRATPEIHARKALEIVIKEYDSIFLLSDLDRFMEDIATQCNLNKKLIPKTRSNATNNRPALESISEKTRQLIASKNNADLIFYGLLKEHLSES